MVIITRSKSSGVNMSVKAQMREYLENLIKPLLTNQPLEILPFKFIERIISKFEDKLREKKFKDLRI